MSAGQVAGKCERTWPPQARPSSPWPPTSSTKPTPGIGDHPFLRCKRNGIKPTICDSIINKTLSSYRTNRIIGGVAPSEYLAKLESGNATTPPIDRDRLDGYLRSHLINPSLLRADRFDDFMADRQKQLLALIERATGRAAYVGDILEEGEDVEADDDTAEAELTISRD